jgi:hypothetical protein
MGLGDIVSTTAVGENPLGDMILATMVDGGPASAIHDLGNGTGVVVVDGQDVPQVVFDNLQRADFAPETLHTVFLSLSIISHVRHIAVKDSGTTVLTGNDVNWSQANNAGQQGGFNGDIDALFRHVDNLIRTSSLPVVLHHVGTSQTAAGVAERNARLGN